MPKKTTAVQKRQQEQFQRHNNSSKETTRTVQKRQQEQFKRDINSSKEANIGKSRTII